MRNAGYMMAVATIALIGTWVAPAFAQGQGMMGPGMMGMGTMGMGMGMMGEGPGMGMIDRVEGRIAFLRAELKITDAQAPAWDEFADALRSNARNLGATRRGMMMGRVSAGQSQAQTLLQRLDAQEQWLSTRLEGTRTLKTAFGKLNAALSAEQRDTAEELLAPHMGMRMGPMAQGGMMRRGR